MVSNNSDATSGDFMVEADKKPVFCIRRNVHPSMGGRHDGALHPCPLVIAAAIAAIAGICGVRHL